MLNITLNVKIMTNPKIWWYYGYYNHYSNVWNIGNSDEPKIIVQSQKLLATCFKISLYPYFIHPYQCCTIQRWYLLVYKHVCNFVKLRQSCGAGRLETIIMKQHAHSIQLNLYLLLPVWLCVRVSLFFYSNSLVNDSLAGSVKHCYCLLKNLGISLYIMVR